MEMAFISLLVICRSWVANGREETSLKENGFLRITQSTWDCLIIINLLEKGLGILDKMKKLKWLI
jgi:hypothetical protein